MAYFSVTTPGVCCDCSGPLPIPRHGRRVRCLACHELKHCRKTVSLKFSDFAEDWRSGVRSEDIAAKHGVCLATIYKAARAAGEDRKRVYKKSPVREIRAQQMVDAYAAGLSLEKIGEIHGVTRERVRQIISARGITRFDGGPAIKTAAQKAARAAAKESRRDQRCLRVYGCIYAAIEALLGESVKLTTNKAARAYIQQKRNSDYRGIEFSLTFPQWWAVWQKSGKWEQRGRGDGYVMARKGDVGSYSVGNVYICTQSQNSKDSYLKTPASVRAEKARLTREANGASRVGPGMGLGRGKGWTFNPKCKTKPYQVVAGRKYVGMYATEKEARDAYVAACEKIRSNAANVAA